MKNAIRAAATLAFAVALPTVAGSLPISGAPTATAAIDRYSAAIGTKTGVTVNFSNVETGRAMLDLIEGKVPAAAVSTTLVDAVAAAREAAWSDHRLVAVPQSLQFHEVSSTAQGSVGFVTVGAPSVEMQRVLDYLRSPDGRMLTRAAP